ncbi:MAG: hypothetical protein IPK16_27305 [Anaerolineales bacterium]|nr:hypothetical protein [Anaerolineales bacterium]
MQRNTAILVSGFATAVVAAVVITVSSAFLQTPSTAFAVDATQAVQSASGDQNALSQDVIAAREVAYAAQLDSGKRAITELDAQMQPQITALQAQLADLEQQTNVKSVHVQDLAQQLSALQGVLEQDAAQVQQQAAALQATEAGLRQQLDITVAQLQSAYAELSARQSSAGGPSVSGEQHEHEEEHEDHEEDEHGEHEDGEDD